MTGTPISAEEAAKLLALPKRQSRQLGGQRVEIPGLAKTVRIDTSIRTYPMWWKLPTSRADCEVSAHDEQESKRNRMCFKLNEVMVCRYCYLNSRDKL